MKAFHVTAYAQEVIFGAGSFGQVGQIIERIGRQHVLLCTGNSQRRSGAVADLKNQLGERLVASCEDAQTHVPALQVDEVVELAEARQVDAVIGLGGGSALGLAKAVGFVLARKREAGRDAALTRAQLPVMAIPTTYAGSEMTPVYGITRVEDGQARKQTVSDPRITPQYVIYDPQLTLGLPAKVTAATGINALAHCIEALYSLARNPLSSALALSGIPLLVSALPRCCASGDDRLARSEMLEGAYLAGAALAHVTMALHHGLCHVLGGTAGLAHGVANAIILPHAMRFNLNATAEQLFPACEVLGIALTGAEPRTSVATLIGHINGLIRRLGLPQRLRDVGVREADLTHLAHLALQNRTVRNNPVPITEVAQLEGLLRAAW